jgi:hypothetical protein
VASQHPVRALSDPRLLAMPNSRRPKEIGNKALYPIILLPDRQDETRHRFMQGQAKARRPSVYFLFGFFFDFMITMF